MLKKWQFWAVVAAISSLVGLFTFGFTTDPKFVKSPLVGRPAPGFNLQPLAGGEPLSLRDLRGTPVVLNFWASWCVACRDEAAVLEAGHLRHEKEAGSIRVIGIAVQDTPEEAMAFARRYGKTYFLGLDNYSGEISLNYGLYGVPETFFIDREGIVRFKQVGAVTTEIMRREVEKLIAAGTGGSR